MLRTIRLHGRLKKKFGGEFQFEASTPAEMVRALCTLVPGFEDEVRDRRYKFVRGNKAEGLHLTPQLMHLGLGGTRELHLIPTQQMAGKGGLGKVLLGAVMIGAAFATGGASLSYGLVGSVGAGSIGVTGIALTGVMGFVAKVGLLMTLGGLSRLLTPNAKANQPGNDADKRESFLFSGAENTAQQGLAVPIVYGRVRAGSVVVSAGIKAEQITVAPVGGISGSGTVGFPGNPRREWYDADLAKGGKGAGGSATAGQEDPNTLQSNSTARVIDLVSEGPIVGLVDGLKSVYLDDVVVQNPDDSFNFKGFHIQSRLGNPADDPMPGFSDTEAEVAVGVKCTVVTPLVRAISDTNVEAVRLTVQLPSLFQIDDKGAIKGTKVQFAFDISSNGGAYTEVLNETITGKTNTAYQKSFRIQLPGTGPWNIRMRRITPDSSVSKLQNDIFWSSYTEIVDARLMYPNSAMFGLTVDARQFGSNIPNRAYDVKGRIIQVPANYDPETRTYATSGTGTTNGLWNGTFKLAWTDNPAWILYDLLTHSRYALGQDVPAEYPNKWTLYEIGQYCDQLVPDGAGGMEPRYTINTQITTRGEAWNLLANVVSVFRGMFFWGSGAIEFSYDHDEAPSKLVTKANTVDGKINYSTDGFRQRHSVVIVAWNDPELGGRVNYEVVEDPDLIELYGHKVLETTAWGCTSRGQAARTGRWILDTEKYGEIVNYVAGIDHADCRPGQIVEINDPEYTSHRFAGRVASGSSASLIQLDAPVTKGAGGQLRVVLPDGTVESRDVTTGAGSPTALAVSPAFSDIPLAGAIWSYAEEGIENRLFKVLAVEEASPLEYRITGVWHDPNKFLRVEEQLDLPPNSFSDIPTGQLTPPADVNMKDFLFQEGNATTPGALISWPASTDPRVTHYQWQVKPAGDEDWGRLGSTTRLEDELRNIAAGSYSARVRSCNRIGHKSAWKLRENINLVGDTDPIPDITGLVVGIDPDSLTAVLRWDPVTDPTGRPCRYEVLYHPASTVFADALTVGKVDTTEYVLTTTGYFWVRATFGLDVVGDATMILVTVDDLPRGALDGMYQPIDTVAPGAPTLPVNPLTSIIRTDPVTKALVATLTFTWDPITDTDLDHYEVQFKEGSGGAWQGGYVVGNDTLSVVRDALHNTNYYARVRAVDKSGNVGPWSAEAGPHLTIRDLTPPAVPTSLAVSNAFNSLFLTWTNPANIDLAYIEVWEHTSNASGSATRIATVMAQPNTQGSYAKTGIPTGETRYYWLKAVDFSGNASAFTAVASGTTSGIQLPDFADDLEPISTVAALPNPVGYTGPKVVLYNGLIYRYVSGAWVKNVAGTEIEAGAIDRTKFASGIQPVDIVSALPTPINGRTVYHTGTKRMYTSDGTTWKEVVNAGDMVGQITSTQIADDSISTPKLQANSITANKLKLLPQGVTLNADPYLKDATVWEATGTSELVVYTFTTSPNAWKASTSSTLLSEMIPIHKDKVYRYSVQAVSSVGADKKVYLCVAFYDQYGSPITGSASPSGWPSSGTYHYFGLVNSTPPDNAVGNYAITFGPGQTAQIPVGASYVRIGALYGRDGTTGFNLIGTPELKEVIGAEMIVNGAITADKIAANAITVGKVAAGAIGAAEIAAGAITTSKLIIAGSTNTINPDPGFQDDSIWDVDIDAGSVVSSYAYQGNKMLRINGTSRLLEYTDHKVPIDAKKTYLIKWMIRRSAAATGPCYGVFKFWESNGTLIPTSGAPGWPASNTATSRFYAPAGEYPPSSDTWHEYSYSMGPQGTLQIPSNAAFVSFGFWANYSSGSVGIYDVGLLSITEMTRNELLVDGAITASKLSIGATTDNLMYNGFGETGNTDGWKFPNAVTPTGAAVDFVSANEGSYKHTKALFIYKDAQSTGAAAKGKPIPVVGGKQYRLRFRYHGSTTTVGGVYFRVLWGTDSNPTTIGQLGFENGPVSSSSIREFTALWTAPDTARFMSPYVYNWTGGPIALVFGVEVHEAVGTTIIEDGAITTDKVFANAIVADKIASNAIQARHVAAYAITAEKMAIGNFTNLVPNGTFITGDTTGWTPLGSPANITTQAAISNSPTYYAARFIGNGTTVSMMSHGTYPSGHGIPVKAGETYRVSVECRYAGSVAPTGARIYLWGKNSDGSGATAAIASAAISPLTQTFNEFAFDVTIPAGYESAWVYLYWPTSESGSNLYWTNVRCIRRYGGELIVDGAITTNHMTANSINADRLQAGTITADKLKANEIITQRLNIGSTDFQLNGGFNGTGKGAIAIQSGGVYLGIFGWVTTSEFGIRLRNSSNQIILDHTYNPLESGADVTSAVTGAAEIVIECDYNGTPLSGELPVYELYKLIRNGSDVSGGSTWAVSTVSGTVGASIASNGGLTISSIGSNTAQIRITATYAGKARTMEVVVRKNIAPPPPPPPSANSSTKSVGGTITNTTWITVVSHTLNIVGTTATLSGSITINPADLSSPNQGSWTVQAQWEWWNGSSWVLVGTTKSGTTESKWLFEDVQGGSYRYYETKANFSMSASKTSLTAGASQQFRMVARVSAGGTHTHYVTGSSTVEG